MPWTDLPSLLESAMLICFGVSWPVAIAKTLRVRRVSGKSLPFLLLVLAGYLCGIAAKFVLASQRGEPIPWYTSLYAFNALMVCTDAVLHVYFTRYPGGRNR